MGSTFSSELPLPDCERDTYFEGREKKGWMDILCCPNESGCTLKLFDPDSVYGGELCYKVKLWLSHCEDIPKYQVYVIDDRTTKQWIIGYLEKTETHLRAKPGEFLRVQVWELTCSMVAMEMRRSALNRRGWGAMQDRPTSSSLDMQVTNLVISTQAKRDPGTPDVSGAIRFDAKSERWVQRVSVDDPSYLLKIAAPPGGGRHNVLETMTNLKIHHRKKKVAVAKKQRFGGTVGNICQPFLGVSILTGDDMNELRPNFPFPDDPRLNDNEEIKSKMLLKDPTQIMLLLISLAWSEETMSSDGDRTDRFVKAMRASPQDIGSADEIGLSVQWDIDDVEALCPPGTVLHHWDPQWALRHQDEVGSEDEPQDELEAQRATSSLVQ